MPCVSYDDGSENRRIREKLDKYARMLCSVCTYMEQSDLPIPREANEWWEHHKEQDRKAEEARHKQQTENLKRKKALNKLTAEEIKLLRLK